MREGPTTSPELQADLPYAPQTEQALELIEKVGEGGMGQVLRVLDRRFGREAALKLLKSDRRDKGSRARFCREARVAALLDHPGIPTVYEYGETSRGKLFILMKLVRGQTLEQHLQDPAAKGLQPSIASILAKVCDALAYAHDRGVIHRDIKPENIMIGRFGEVYLMDWGLARHQEEDIRLDASFRLSQPGSKLTQKGSVLGTWGYLSPEQALGEDVTPASDIYSLGAVLYASLWGRPPIEIAGIEGLAATVQGRIAFPPSAAPQRLISICKRCLATDPKDRPRNASQIAQSLRSVEGDGPSKTGERGLALAVVFLLFSTLFFVGLWWIEREQNGAFRERQQLPQKQKNSSPATKLALPAKGLVERPPPPPTMALPRDAKLQRAIALVEQQRFKDAEHAFRKILADAPDFGQAYSERGRLFQKQARYHEALEDYTRALKNHPPCHTCYAFRGSVHYILKNSEEALKDLNRALEIKPGFRNALINRGLVHVRKEQFAAALGDFNKIIAFDPDDGDAYYLRAMVRYSLQQIPAAFDDLDRTIKLAPKNARAWHDRGFLTDQKNRPKEALKYFNQAINLSPDMASARSHRGRILVRLKQFDSALDDLNKAIKLDPENASAYLNRARVYQFQKRSDKAQKDFARAYKLEPNLRPQRPRPIDRIQNKLRRDP